MQQADGHMHVQASQQHAHVGAAANQHPSAYQPAMVAQVDVVDLVCDDSDSGEEHDERQLAAYLHSPPRKAARSEVHATPSKSPSWAQAAANSKSASKRPATGARMSKKASGKGQQSITSFLLRGAGTALPAGLSPPVTPAAGPPTSEAVDGTQALLEPTSIMQHVPWHACHASPSAGQPHDRDLASAACLQRQHQPLEAMQLQPTEHQALQYQDQRDAQHPDQQQQLVAVQQQQQQDQTITVACTAASVGQPAPVSNQPPMLSVGATIILPAVPVPGGQAQQQMPAPVSDECTTSMHVPAAAVGAASSPVHEDNTGTLLTSTPSSEHINYTDSLPGRRMAASLKDDCSPSGGRTGSMLAAKLQPAKAPGSPAAFFKPHQGTIVVHSLQHASATPGPTQAQAPAPATSQVEGGTQQAAQLGLAGRQPSPAPAVSNTCSAFFTPAKQLRQEQAKQQRALGGPLFSPAAVALPWQQYDPVAHACWSAGTPAPFAHLVYTFCFIDSTTKRLEIGNALTNMFRSLLALSTGASDVVAACYLCTGRIAAAHEPNGEMHIGGATVAAAVRQVTGATRARMSQLYAQLGDLGDVAQACQRSQVLLRQPPPLTLSGLMSSLRAMASDQGTGSAGRRQRVVEGLLRATRSDNEIKYLVRLLIQNLRVGANWKSVIGPLARAVTIHREGIRTATKVKLDAAAATASEAYHLCPSWELLVEALLEGGVQQLKDRCSMVPGVPIKPQLARICEGLSDAMRILGPGCSFLAEYKYDGRRAQIHLLPDGQVKIFSRHCEDSTSAFPDVVQVVKQAAGLMTAGTVMPPVAGVATGSAVSAAASPASAATGSSPPSLVLDAELVGVERDSSSGVITRLCAFQELATRARGEVASHQVGTAVCVFVFDLLFLNGAPLLGHSLRERLALLSTALPHMRPGFIQPATHTEVILPSSLGQVVKELSLVPGATVADGAGTPSVDELALEREQVAAGPGPGAMPVSGDMAPEVTDMAGATALGTINQAQTGSHVAFPQQPDRDTSMQQALVQPIEALAGDQLTGDVAAGAQDEPAACSVLRPADAVAAEQLLMDLMMQAHEGGTEGLVLKRLDGPSSTYEPSKRTDSWVKLKRDYCEGLRDSLDLAVIGAWQGNGRKVSWLSPFLLATWDPVTEQLQSVCRCMSGFTDAFYQAATERLLKTRIPGPKPYFQTGEQCDYWFEPTEVWELRGAELSLSPVHRAAAGRVPGTERGLALRFPRFIRVRDDKRIEDTTDPDTLLGMFLAQNRRAGGG